MVKLLKFINVSTFNTESKYKADDVYNIFVRTVTVISIKKIAKTRSYSNLTVKQLPVQKVKQNSARNICLNYINITG